MTWEVRPSPNHGDPRQLTLGVVIHSTRGGAASQQAEYAATINWFANPISEVSAHRVIGFEGAGAVIVDDDLIAWHATDHNNRWLGVELTEPFITDPYSEEQYRSLADLLLEWSAKYGFPLDRDHLVAHSEVNPQKSDPGPLFDWDRLMALLLGGDMQSIIESLNREWALLDAIQQHPEATQAIKDLAEQVKQEGVVEVKKAIGLQ